MPLFALLFLSILFSITLGRRVPRPPQGYTGLVVTLVDGKYNLSETNPNVPNCPPNILQCDGAFFWENIARMDPAPFRASGDQYMMTEWGLDVDKLIEQNDMLVSNIYLDPRANYRAHIVSGYSVHRKGWELHDQAFFYVLLKPAILNGDSGKNISVPAGTAFAFGQYWIQKSFLFNGLVVSLPKFLKLFYQSRVPIPPLTSAPAPFLCSITESPWGTGLASLVVFNQNIGFEVDASFLRGVITLDGRDGLGTFPGVFNE